MAEYEALLLGFSLATKHEIKKLLVWGDSKLIVSQVRLVYSSKNDRFKQYISAI